MLFILDVNSIFIFLDAGVLSNQITYQKDAQPAADKGDLNRILGSPAAYHVIAGIVLILVSAVVFLAGIEVLGK